MTKHKVPIEVSARHLHLSAFDFTRLFGESGSLTIYKKISQPNQFAANEMVEVNGPKGSLKLRVVGPLREETQIELSATDCKKLGIPVVLRISSDLKGTPGCLLVGPASKVELSYGVIVPQRHLHISPSEAKEFGLNHGDKISVSTSGTRPITFHDVYVRSREGIDSMSLMIDTDEANAAGLKGNEIAVIENSYET